MKKKAFWILLIMLAWGTVGCSSRAAEITCTVEWRSDASLDAEERETIVLRDVEGSESVTLRDLSFHAEYQPGNEVRMRSLRVWVTPPVGSPELMSQVYDLPKDSGPTDQFLETGFTGKTLFYNPDPLSDSILQYYCSVSG